MTLVVCFCVFNVCAPCSPPFVRSGTDPRLGTIADLLAAGRLLLRQLPSKGAVYSNSQDGLNSAVAGCDPRAHAHVVLASTHGYGSG